MDPPENSVNRFGRTIWTVWGYLSGAVARYLRPEVTAEGNQSVCARTEEIDREVKTNNSDSENDRAEVKCFPSKVRAAASVQWENTGVVNNDNNDKLHLHTTDKQTYHHAAWCTGTEALREGQRDSSDDVQTEKEHANREREERETPQELEIIAETEQKDDDDEEECEENHESEKSPEKREDMDVMIQSEQDEGQDKQIIMMDHRESEDAGGLKPADEHPTETEAEDAGGLKPAGEHPTETEAEDAVQKNQEKTERDEDQEPESKVQGLLEDFTNEANTISKPERLKAMDKYPDKIDEFFKNQIEEMMLETEQDEEREATQELEITGETEQKDGDNKEECEENCKSEKSPEKREDTDVMIQSEQDEGQDKQIIMMDHRETEDAGGLKPADEHPTETESGDAVQKNQEKIERDEDQEPESQVQKDLTDEVNNINEFSKSGVEEMLGSEQDEENTEMEQDMTKYELMESAETLQKVSESEKHAPDETELRMTTVVVETIEALEDTLRMDSEQDTSENTPESGTGSSVLATKTEAMFSDLTVREFPGEPRTGLETDWGCFEEIQTKLHNPQAPEEERSQRDSDETQHDTETVIQTDRTQLSLREHDEFRTELIVETIETKISSEDEEAEALETESQAPVISNVTSQPHQPLEFTETLYKSSQETMDAFSETQGNASASETEDRAELVSTELLEEPRDVEKTALQFVEEITNQVLNEMIDTEAGFSAEDPAPAVRVSADASVLEEEQKILTMDSSEEHISSGPEADGRHGQIQKSIAGEAVSRSQEDLMEVSRSGMKRAFDQVSTGLPETRIDGRFDLILQAFEDSSLDFSVQKCRIAVKNPLVRPPKDPRKLLFRTSVEPQTLRGSAPNKPMIGFKLPGLGAGLPGLRKTELGQKTEAERTLQQKSVTEDSVKQEQVPAKPKWTPPRHPGMGSPFMMAELKSKLKKPVQE